MATESSAQQPAEEQKSAAPVPAEEIGASYRKLFGGLAIASTSVLTLFIIFVCYVVLNALTTEPETLQTVRDHLLRDVAEQSTNPPVDENSENPSRSVASQHNREESLALTFRSIAVLEYATADIRMAGVQLAVALVSGLLFVTVGLLLFSLGLAAPIDFSGQSRNWQWKFATSSPGVLGIVLGGVIVLAGVMKDVRQTLSADISQPTGVTISPAGPEPDLTKQGLPSGADIKRPDE